jgi:Lipocalin-like domain
MKNYFKKISILSIIVLFISCAKSDEVPPSIIGGRWLFDKTVPYTNGVAEPEINHPANFEGCEKNYYEFFADSKIKYTNFDVDCVKATETSEYLLEGNKIQFKELPLDGKITTLNETDLVIEYRVPFFDAMNNDIGFVHKYKRVR